jgi:hypothetical protein
VLAGAVAKNSLRPHAHCSSPRPETRRYQQKKASAATLSQQEVKYSKDVQRGGVNLSGFFGEKVS